MGRTIEEISTSRVFWDANQWIRTKTNLETMINSKWDQIQTRVEQEMRQEEERVHEQTRAIQSSATK